MEKLRFENFSDAREKGLSLREIKNEIKKLSQEQREQLSKEINNQIIQALQKGLVVKKGDELNFLKALTLEGNTIKWIDKKNSDLIHSGDIIKVEGNKILKNGNIIGNVTGFLSEETKHNNEYSINTEEKPINETMVLEQKGSNSTSTDTILTEQTPTNIDEKPTNVTSTNSDIKPNDISTIPAFLDEVEIPSDEYEKPTYTETYIFENGTVFLIGENQEKIVQSQELSPESKELLKNYEKASILGEVLDIWKDKAIKVADGLYWKDSRDTDEIILDQVNNVDVIFSSLFEDIQKGKNIDEKINKIWKHIETAEKEKSIIGINDMIKVKSFLISGFDTKDQKLTKIYNQMRYGGLSGNSDMVKEKVAAHLLHSPEFKDINDILENPKLLEYISNNNKAELEKILGKDVSKTILETYSKIKSKQEKHRDEYAMQLAPINKERLESGENEISLDEFIKLNVDLSIENILTHALIENKIEKEENRGSEKDSYKGIYANMVGLGENKGFFNDKIFTISDSNIDTAIDVSSTIALGIVSMGAGAIAARGVLAAATWGTRATGLASGVSKLGRAGSLAKFGGTATVEGVAFYEGTTITSNLIYGNSDWNSETLNTKEIVKTIAFMGVLRGATKVMENAKLANVIKQNSKVSLGGKGLDLGITGNTISLVGRIGEKVPPLMFKNTSITAVLAEAGLLTATSVGLEFAFEGEAEWSWEEYFQALVMVGVIKGAGMTFSNKNGKIEAKTEAKKGEKAEAKTETKETKTETKEANILSKYENKRFEEMIQNHLKGNKSIILEKINGDKIHIKTNSSGKYIINGKESKPLSKKEMFSQIDDTFKIDFLNNKNYENILKIGKSGEIKLLRTLGHPIDGKIQIKEGGKVTLNGKDLSLNRAKQLLKIPKVRESILKERLDRMSASDILKNIEGKKGFEKLKGLSNESLKFGLERFKASRKAGLIGGLVGVGIEALIDGSQKEEIDGKIWDLLLAFGLGATGGLAISVVKTGGLATWGIMKKGGSLLKIGYDITPVKKILIGSVVIGGVAYYFYNTDSQESE